MNISSLEPCVVSFASNQSGLCLSQTEINSFFEVFPDLWIYIGLDGSILEYKAQATSELYLEPEVWRGQTIQAFLPVRVGELFQNTIRQAIHTQTPASLEYSLSSDQTKRYYEARIVPLMTDRAIAIVRNISDRKRIEEQLIHDALHDSLTELPNRSLFIDRLDMALQRFKRLPRATFAVLFMDLDHFKDINDQFGHGVGDQLLVAIAHILRQCVRANDTVSRLGGDEFTILLDSPTILAQAKQVADRIQQALTSPLVIADQSITIGASIGLVLSANHYVQSAEVLRDADIALYQAKENGKGQSVVFTG